MWVFLCVMSFLDENFMVFGSRIHDTYIVFGVPLGFWVFLYVFFWISSGFTNDNKKDETNE